MDLGARRLISSASVPACPGVASDYAQAFAQQHDKTQRRSANQMLEEISSNNGRCQDLRDGYRRSRPSTARFGSVKIVLTGSTMLPSVTIWKSNGGSAAATSLRRGSRLAIAAGSARGLVARLARDG